MTRLSTWVTDSVVASTADVRYARRHLVTHAGRSVVIHRVAFARRVGSAVTEVS